MTNNRPDNETILKALAEHADRVHILRHLEAHGAMGEMDAYEVAYEEGIDPDEATAKEIVEAFTKGFSLFLNEVMPEGSESRKEWREHVEEKYGEEADTYLSKSEHSESEFI
jgi:predicted secreted protein